MQHYCWDSLIFALFLIFCTFIRTSNALAPVFSGLPTSVSVGEKETDNRLIYTITVSDPDGDAVLCDVNHTTPAGGPFRVLKDTNTDKFGVNLLTPAFDFAVTKTHTVTLKCDDLNGGTVYADLSVDIIDEDKLVIVGLPNDVTKDASTTGNDVTIATLSATDALSHTPLTWSMVAHPSFKIDTGSGEVKSAQELKYETTTPIQLYITVTDGFIEYTEILTVKLTNVNNVPKFINLPGPIYVLENLAAGTVLFTMTSYDGDAGASLTYTIDVSPSTGKPLFTYNTNTQQVALTTGSNFDYETTTYFNVTFTVFDTMATGGPFAVDVHIQNVNEACYFDAPLYPLSLNEGVAGSQSKNPGFTVADYDGVSTYSLSFQTGNNSERFSIDASTGVIGFATDYDVDNNAMPTSVILTVECKDPTGETGTAQVSISISDVNDNPPVFAQTSYVVTVDQLKAAGSLLVAISPTDADSGTNAQFTCSGTPSTAVAGTYYNIGNDCGVYLIATPFGNIDYGTMVRFTVTATDKGTTPLSGSTFVDIIFKETTTTTTTTTTAATTTEGFWDNQGSVAAFVLALLFGLFILGLLLYLLIRWCYTGSACGKAPFDFCNCRHCCRRQERRPMRREVKPRTPENPRRKKDDFDYWREDSDYGSMTKDVSRPRPQKGGGSFNREYPDFPRTERLTPTDIRPTTRILPISYY